MILKIIKKNRLLININSYICIRKQLSYKQKTKQHGKVQAEFKIRG
jgi:hypothetical protein